MIDKIESQEEFLERLRAEIGEVSYSETCGNCKVYSITDARDMRYQNINMNIVDMGKAGIGISLTGLQKDKKITGARIYSWQDAYSLLYTALTREEELFFLRSDNDSIKDIDVCASLGLKMFDFEWKPDCRFYDIEDSKIELALE